jgi:hypothetical protein
MRIIVGIKEGNYWSSIYQNIQGYFIREALVDRYSSIARF